MHLSFGPGLLATSGKRICTYELCSAIQFHERRNAQSATKGTTYDQLINLSNCWCSHASDAEPSVHREANERSYVCHILLTFRLVKPNLLLVVCKSLIQSLFFVTNVWLIDCKVWDDCARCKSSVTCQRFLVTNHDTCPATVEDSDYGWY